jgi:4-diphosphocytidyl-2-C-methyl-D-erythritol kinase
MSGSGASVFGIFDEPIEHIDEIFSGYFCRQREFDV